MLQGLVPTIRLAENEYKFREDRSVTAAKELLKGHMRCFKQASSRLAVDKDGDVQVLTWNAIIRVTEEVLLFQHHPKLLMEINPDLVGNFTLLICIPLRDGYCPLQSAINI